MGTKEHLAAVEAGSYVTAGIVMYNAYLAKSGHMPTEGRNSLRRADVFISDALQSRYVTRPELHDIVVTLDEVPRQQHSSHLEGMLRVYQAYEPRDQREVQTALVGTQKYIGHRLAEDAARIDRLGTVFVLGALALAGVGLLARRFRKDPRVTAVSPA